MNYRHFYHAGNFADIFKHLVLIETISAAREENIARAVDYFAASGLYSLPLAREKNSFESENGIIRLLDNFNSGEASGNLQSDAPNSLKKYLGIIAEANNLTKSKLNANKLRLYPGSAYILSKLLPHKKLHFNELATSEFKQLKSNFKSCFKITLSSKDGFSLANQHGRALKNDNKHKGYKIFFLDPAFENANDEEDAINAAINLSGLSNTIVILWTPIKDLAKFISFQRRLRQNFGGKLIFSRLSLHRLIHSSLADNCMMIMGGISQDLAEELVERISILLEFVDNKIYNNESFSEVKILDRL
jgi:23S rRNA (adenine2030-N6)-methyltransferase